MPNWCHNCLCVTGPEEDVRRFQKQAVGFSPWDTPEAGQPPSLLSFHSLMPVPPDMLRAGVDVTARHDWLLSHWGCQSGACRIDLVEEWPGELRYNFVTAWSPPVPWLKHLGVTWPTLLFVLNYEEPMLAYQGFARAEADLWEDHCISLCPTDRTE